jgi:hypothetical protein
MLLDRARSMPIPDVSSVGNHERSVVNRMIRNLRRLLISAAIAVGLIAAAASPAAAGMSYNHTEPGR